MKKLYDEFFRVPQHGNICEKVMLTRVVLTVVIIIACLAAMSYTAYAYFSCNITSTIKSIKAVSFKTEILIKNVDDNVDVIVTDTNDTIKVAELFAGKTYLITIDEAENSTAGTGYVIVSYADCPMAYHTQQLGNDTNAVGGRTEQINFELKVTKDVTVYFEDNWGTSSLYANYVDNGDAGAYYITNNNIGANAVEMVIGEIANADGAVTQSPVPEATQAPTQTPTPEATQTPTQTPTPEVTQAPTQTSTPEATQAPTQTSTPEATQAPTQTSTPEAVA